MVVKHSMRPHWRTVDMARALGINIAAALFDRRIDQQAYGDMVDTCARCTWAEACALWVRTEGDGADTAPDICGNRKAFAALKA